MRLQWQSGEWLGHGDAGVMVWTPQPLSLCKLAKCRLWIISSVCYKRKVLKSTRVSRAQIEISKSHTSDDTHSFRSFL